MLGPLVAASSLFDADLGGQLRDRSESGPLGVEKGRVSKVGTALVQE